MRLTGKDEMFPMEALSHDTRNMDFLSSDGDWDVFGFGPSHSCHNCLAPIGGLFLIYEHRPTGTTLMTPCVQNDASFELSIPNGDVLIFGHLNELLALAKPVAGISLPSKTSIWANQRWFVDHPEARSREALFEPTQESNSNINDPIAIH